MVHSDHVGVRVCVCVHCTSSVCNCITRGGSHHCNVQIAMGVVESSRMCENLTLISLSLTSIAFGETVVIEQAQGEGAEHRRGISHTWHGWIK